MLLIDEARAIETLPALLPDDPAVRAEALAVLRRVVEAAGEMPEEAARRMAKVERMFGRDARALLERPTSDQATLPQAGAALRFKASPRPDRPEWAAAGARGSRKGQHR